MIQEDLIISLKKKILSHVSRVPGTLFPFKEITKHLRITSKTELRQVSQLLDELVNEGTVIVDAKGRYRYQPERSGARPGKQKGRLIGTLRVHRRRGGLVLIDDSPDEIFVPDKSMSTALHGDKVVVVPLARRAGRPGRGADEKIEGEIVEVLERANTRIVGRLEKSGHFLFVVPDDSRMRRDVYVTKEEAAKASIGDKVLIDLLPWSNEHLNPEGTIAENLGPSGNPQAEVLSVARSFGLPSGFPADVVHESERLPAVIPPTEIRARLDLRGITSFTIDPLDAKDFDDALSIEQLRNGNIRLGVHIADVSHYVLEGTALDREALQRGTSVYLVNEVVPMLPERLSNDLCSLRPAMDRLTFSVLMEINANGTVEQYEIVKTVIHSAQRFTYEEAQQTLKSGSGKFVEELRSLDKLSKLLHRKRMKKGSLDFDTAEVKFVFDAQGLPEKIIKKERLEAHRLVEECMLLANQTVARHIGSAKVERRAKPFIYRIHDAPNPERLRDLANFVKQFGFSLDVKQAVSSMELQHLLDRVKGSEVELLINEVALRSMAKAVYSENNIGHFGLAFQHYAHFTSPIRRYPDLMIHRLLQEYHGKVSAERLVELEKRIPFVAKKSSERERVAVEAERASIKVMQVEYLKRHLGDVLEGVIGGVAEFGLFVEIDDLLIEGLVKVRDLADDYYIFDERQYSLRGRSTGKVYRLGDRVRVRVVSVDSREHEIDMLIVS